MLFFRFQYAILGCVLLIAGWLGLSSYRYFFDTLTPSISISGLENDGWYAGDLQCKVAANKKGYLSAFLDGQPVINNYWLSKREHEHPFAIPTKTISNGKHQLTIELIDSSYNHNKVSLERSFFVDNTPLQAAFVRSDAENKVFQGRTLHVQFQVNKEIQDACIKTLSNTYACFPESKGSSVYECFIPISCEEAPNEYLMNVDITDKVGTKVALDTKFQVVMYPFKKDNLKVSSEKVEQEKALGLDTDKLETALNEISKASVKEKLWRGPFIAPIDSPRITCEFGSIRTTQEKGRYMHKGLDVVNMPKGVVWAPQDGLVVHKERYAFTGNTVVIDHGCGVLSLFFHLDNFSDIKLGQKVAKGNPVGTIGKTGYATGYHLHWEMRVNNIQVDPMQWTRASF